MPNIFDDKVNSYLQELLMGGHNAEDLKTQIDKLSQEPGAGPEGQKASSDGIGAQPDVSQQPNLNTQQQMDPTEADKATINQPENTPDPSDPAEDQQQINQRDVNIQDPNIIRKQDLKKANTANQQQPYTTGRYL